MQGISVPVEDPRNRLRLRKLMPSDEHLKEKTKEEVEKQDACFKYLMQDLKWIFFFKKKYIQCNTLTFTGSYAMMMMMTKF